MDEARRVRRRLYQDEEAEEAPPRAGRGSGGAEDEAVATAAASSPSTASPPPSTTPTSTSPSLVSPSAVKVVAAGEGGTRGASAALISPRTHAFSSETWWMVDLESNPAQGATRLAKTCMHAYGWDSNKARSVLRAYRQFLFLKAKYKDYDAKLLSPSRTVDMMWHQHILDVVNYVHDCALLCGGRVVGHNPRGSEEGSERDERRSATRQALRRHKDEIGIEDEQWKEIMEEVETGSSMIASVAQAPRSAGVAPSSEVSKFLLRVVTHSGGSFMVRAHPDSVRSSDVYDYVARKTKVPVNTFRLMYGGRQLDPNHSPIRALGLINESTVYQILTDQPANQSSEEKDLDTAIQVHITTPIGSVFTVKLYAESGRVSDMYDSACAKMMVPSRTLRLIFNGQPLDRRCNTSLRALGLRDFSRVYVMKTGGRSPDYSECPVQLYYRNLKGKVVTILVWLDSGRLSDLFDAVHANEGVPSKDCRLIFGGQQLEYDTHKSLREGGLRQECTIHMLLRLRGC